MTTTGRAIMRLFKSGGPFLGPRGGKWADAAHTIPWKESKPQAKRVGGIPNVLALDGFGKTVVPATPENIHAVERDIRGREKETGVVLSGKHNILARTGNAETVSFMPSEVKKFRQAKDCVLTHNHPGLPGGEPCLSPADLRAAVEMDLAQIRAVVSDGVFWVKRPEHGWSGRGTQVSPGLWVKDAQDTRRRIAEIDNLASNLSATLGVTARASFRQLYGNMPPSLEQRQLWDAFVSEKSRSETWPAMVSGLDFYGIEAGFTPWAELDLTDWTRRASLLRRETTIHSASAPASDDMVTWVDAPIEQVHALRHRDILNPVTGEPQPIPHMGRGVSGQERWDMLMQSMQRDGFEKFSPIEVGFGSNKDGPYVHDGHHRIGVAMKLGIKTVPVEVKRGLARALGWMPHIAKGGGPYLGPKGGKWADPEHTVHWEETISKPITWEEDWKSWHYRLESLTGLDLRERGDGNAMELTTPSGNVSIVLTTNKRKASTIKVFHGSNQHVFQANDHGFTYKGPLGDREFNGGHLDTFARNHFAAWLKDVMRDGGRKMPPLQSEPGVERHREVLKNVRHAIPQREDASDDYRETLDAVTAMTNGSVEASRDPSKFNPAASKGIHGRDGYTVPPMSKEDYERAHQILLTLANGKPPDVKGPCYRGMSVPKSLMDKWEVGGDIDLGPFGSWSMDDAVSRQFSIGSGERVLLRMEPIRGSDITAASTYIRERELLTGGKVTVARTEDSTDRFGPIRIIDCKQQELSKGGRVDPGLQAFINAEFDQFHNPKRRAKALQKAGGPFIGPKGGRWANPQHTIPWVEPRPKESSWARRPSSYSNQDRFSDAVVEAREERKMIRDTIAGISNGSLSTAALDKDLWDAALWHDSPGLGREFYQNELATVVGPQGVSSEGEYIKADRKGSMKSLDRATRRAVWGVLGRYLQDRAFWEREFSALPSRPVWPDERIAKAAQKAPAGYTAIPESKHGGFHKKIGGEWRTWYPEHGHGPHPTEKFTHEQHEAQHVPRQKRLTPKELLMAEAASVGVKINPEEPHGFELEAPDGYWFSGPETQFVPYDYGSYDGKAGAIAQARRDLKSFKRDPRVEESASPLTKALESLGLSLLAPQDMAGGIVQQSPGAKRYRAYSASMAGVTHNGQRMPDWDALPHRVRDAWDAVDAASVVDAEGAEWRSLPDDEGERLWAAQLTKGAHHKYLARFPTGNPKRPWKYMYKYTHHLGRVTRRDEDGVRRERAFRTGKHETTLSAMTMHDDALKVGSAFADGVIGQHTGHWVIKDNTRGQWGDEVVIQHDVTGERKALDKWEFRDFIEGLHATGYDAERARRKGVEARLQDEVLDQMAPLVAGPVNKDTAERLSSLGYKLQKLDGFTPEALARRFGVSTEPPKSWGKARSEISELRSKVGDSRLDNPHFSDRDIGTALMFQPDVMKAWVRMRLVSEWLDRQPDTIDAQAFLKQLRNETMSFAQPDEHGIRVSPLMTDVHPDQMEKAIRKALAAVAKSDGYKLSDVRGLREWEYAYRSEFPETEYSTDGRRVKASLEYELERRKVAFASMTRTPTDWSGLNKIVGDMLSTAADPDRPESLGPTLPTKIDETLDPLVSVHGVYVPFSVAMASKESPQRKDFLAKHEALMNETRQAMDSMKPHFEAALQVPIPSIYPQTDGVLLVLRDKFGVPKDAEERNTPKLVAPTSDKLQAWSAASPMVGGVFVALNDDMQQARRLLQSVHPDVMPVVEIAHEGKVGRSWCNGNHVRLQGNADRVTLWHEIGHAIEHSSKEIAEAVHHYWLERSKNSSREKLGGTYEAHEETYRDEWENPYTGKAYDMRANRFGYSTEIVSMGLQNYLHDPIRFYKSDPEHFLLIAAIISGKLGKTDAIPPAPTGSVSSRKGGES